MSALPLTPRPLADSVDDSAEPERAVSMVAQFIVGVGMHEYVECSVIEGQPSDDVGKLTRRNRDLVVQRGWGPTSRS